MTRFSRGDILRGAPGRTLLVLQIIPQKNVALALDSKGRIIEMTPMGLPYSDSFVPKKSYWFEGWHSVVSDEGETK